MGRECPEMGFDAAKRVRTEPWAGRDRCSAHVWPSLLLSPDEGGISTRCLARPHPATGRGVPRVAAGRLRAPRASSLSPTIASWRSGAQRQQCTPTNHARKTEQQEREGQKQQQPPASHDDDSSSSSSSSSSSAITITRVRSGSRNDKDNGKTTSSKGKRKAPRREKDDDNDDDDDDDDDNFLMLAAQFTFAQLKSRGVWFAREFGFDGESPRCWGLLACLLVALPFGRNLKTCSPPTGRPSAVGRSLA